MRRDRRKELLIADLSVCTPKSALGDRYAPGRWKLLPYEHADFSGVMLGAIGSRDAALAAEFAGAFGDAAAAAQVVALNETFDSAAGFSTSAPFFSDGLGDYFGIAGTVADFGTDDLGEWVRSLRHGAHSD